MREAGYGPHPSPRRWFASVRVQVPAVTRSGRAPRPVVAVADKTGLGWPVQAPGPGEGRARSLRCGSERADRRGDRHHGREPARGYHRVPGGRRASSPPRDMRQTFRTLTSAALRGDRWVSGHNEDGGRLLDSESNSILWQGDGTPPTRHQLGGKGNGATDRAAAEAGLKVRP